MGGKYTFWLLLVLTMVLTACAGGGADDDDDDDAAVDDDTANDDDAAPDDDSVDDDTVAPCDDSLRPVVFVHGMLEEGDAFAAQAMRYGANGYCLDRVYTYDYNSLLGPLGPAVTGLTAFIDQVLQETGATQVDLLGHSLGGPVCQQYLKTAAHAAKVAHFANLASFLLGDGIPHDVPTINISSTADTIAGSSEIPGVENVTFDDLDHLQVATSAKSFAAFFTFFGDGVEPATTDIVPADPIDVSGRVVTFALNDAAPNHLVRIYEVSPETGERLADDPLAVLTTDAGGYWSGFTATAEAYYEFEIRDPAGDWPPIHYYREPFPRANNKVYFRCFPPANSLVGWVFKLLPYNDDYPIFAWLNINRAFVYGRDTLTVDGVDLTTPEMADPSITTIAIFFFDANFNGVNDQQPIGGPLSQFVFFRLFDMLLPSDPPRGIPFVFNDRPVTVRNWGSETGGLSIAVFE